VWNCPTVEVSYTYDLDGNTYSATDTKPFFYDNSAKSEAERFVPGQTAFVRVNPQEPQRSILRRGDQPHPMETANSASN